MGHENPGGVIPALIIPFREDGSIDYSLLEKQAAYLLSAGVHGMFINGSTAEGAYLTIEEKTQVLQRVKETLGGRIPLLAACINPSTAGTIGEFRTLEHLEGVLRAADITLDRETLDRLNGTGCSVRPSPFYTPSDLMSLSVCP